MTPDVGLSTQMLQSSIINVFKELKEALFKELKESIMTIFKYKISVKRSFKNEWKFQGRKVY